MENATHTELPCQKQYHRCRARRSTHYFVSVVLFGIAIFLLIRALLNGQISQVLKPIQDENIQGAISSQFNNIYLYVFILPFALHWFRMYLSLIMIDEDPIFYYSTLKPLNLKGKRFEWILRVLLLFVLVWFVENTSNGKYVFGYYFTPIVILYSILCAWDAFLFITIPIGGKSILYNRIAVFTFNNRTENNRVKYYTNVVLAFMADFVIAVAHIAKSITYSIKNYKLLNKAEKSRIKYFLNDILGFGMAFVLILIEAGIIKENNIVYLSSGILLAGAIALITLALDLICNQRDYIKYLKNSIFPNYKNIHCTDPCPIEQSLKS